MRILYLGDVMGRAGRRGITEELAGIKARLKADFTIVNGENASGGMGLSGAHAKILLEAGADCITLGDHAFASDRHMVWIDIRDVPERNVRIAFFIKSDTFPRKPLKISMRPHMNDSIRFPHVTQPVVESEILMCWRDLRVMIRLRRIHPVLTRWLYRKEKMSVHRTRDENIAFF